MSDFSFGLAPSEVGLGLRREMLNSVLEQQNTDIDFLKLRQKTGCLMAAVTKKIPAVD